MFERVCFGLARAALLVCTLPWAAPRAEPAGKVDFDRQIRPILSENCFVCHGPDSGKRQFELRLDTAEGPFMQRSLGGAVIVPGDPAGSTLFRRISTTNKGAVMPPSDTGKKLGPDQVELIRRWIEQGAEYAQHWAFVPPRRPALPSVEESDWVHNPIDRFVLRRLKEARLAPSHEADRVTLQRRLSLDLTGLPPDIDELDAFLADTRPGAWEREVERLLASPHYGERWGRHWLDAARYADSDGFEKDKTREVWFYRDWVIDAFNRDMPYDQFVIEQIAGDLLPQATQSQRVATGFLRNSMINEEGGVDPEQFRMEAMFDRMDAIGKGILGVTIQCAQCHDHKYDPIEQSEYYQLFAFLNNSDEANIAVYTPQEEMERAELLNRIRTIETELQHRLPDWPQRMQRWEEQNREVGGDWRVLRPTVEDISASGSKYRLLEDGSLLAQGYAPTKHRVQMTVRTELQGIRAFRLELLNDPNLPFGGPGRSVNGTGALTEFEVEVAPVAAPEDIQRVKIRSASAQVALPEKELDSIFDDKKGIRRVTGPIQFAFDGDETTAWGIDVGPGRRNQPRQAVFVVETPISNQGGTILNIFLSQRHGGWNSDDNQNNNLGRMRLSVSTAPDAVVDPLPAGVREILAIPPARRSPMQMQTVFSFWRTTVPEWAQANARIEALWSRYPEGSGQLVLQERSSPRSTHVLERGDFLSPMDRIQAGVPAVLHDYSDSLPPNRLGLARWLVDGRSPTTARSLVNRVWQAYFGVGLVATSEDLGTQSEAPSHPQLLDWLAVEFMEQGWSLKNLHRLIVHSATYRQSSVIEEDKYRRDPYNRLLARGARFRVEAEMVRDIALKASGLLTPDIGGPSVFPPAPDFLFLPPNSYGPKHWREEKGPNRYRRALYTFRYRSVPYPMLQAFDAPNADASCVRRSRSNTPLQALTTLNEPLFLEAARALAGLALREGGDADRDRVRSIFRRCLSRTPTPPEVEELLSLLHMQRDRLTQGWLNPWDLAGFQPQQADRLPEGATPVDLAAWTMVARVLLNLDETITKE